MKDLIFGTLTCESAITIYIFHMIMTPRLEAVINGFMIGYIAKLLM